MKKFTIVMAVMLMGALLSVGQSTNITVDGTSRNMIVYAPANLGQNRPLLISLHGMNQDAPYQQGMAKWELVADTAKFVVVYPNGLNKSWDLSGMKDINFILAIIDNMYTKYGIDKSRVYLSGFSMGGMMTYYSMNKIADKIAAFAPVSGYLMGGPNATSTRPIPIIHTHGDADDVVNYSGTTACMSAWVNRDKCPTTAVVTKPYPTNKPSSQCSKKYWGPGDCGVEVVLLTLAGKGHWHSNDDAGVHTTKEIWWFVRKYTTACGNAASVSITSPADNASFTAPAAINLAATATTSTGTISKVTFKDGTTTIGEDATSPYAFSWTNVPAGKYTVTAIATDNSGKTATSSPITIKVNPIQAAYNSTPWPVPGKIEFENYDVGGNGFAYLDNEVNNTGGATFRTDEDVDIENCTDVGTGYNIGYATKGEWMEYTVNVAKAGKYDLTLRAACNGDGRTLSVSAKDVVVAKDVPISSTAGWQTWQDVVVKDIALEAGVQVIRVTIGASDYVNLNYMTFAAQSQSQPTIALKSGWNLIGCPLDGSTDVATALSSIWANVSTVKDLSGFYNKTQPAVLNSLTKLSWGMGYMVKVDKDCVLQWNK